MLAVDNRDSSFRTYFDSDS